MSPKAYEYLRNKFNKNLPHPETIKTWYRNSDLDSEPGLSPNSLEALENLSKDMLEKQKRPLVISLSFDEMAILRNLSWCRATKKFIGLADQGKMNQDGEFTMASNVIMFMASGINAYFEQPIAYNFIQTMGANDRATLLKKVIKAIAERNIIVGNVTFDGYSANGTMCNLLGANVSPEDGEYITYFPNPHNGSKVYILFDASHMEKLIRNTIGMYVLFIFMST